MRRRGACRCAQSGKEAVTSPIALTVAFLAAFLAERWKRLERR